MTKPRQQVGDCLLRGQRSHAPRAQQGGNSPVLVPPLALSPTPSAGAMMGFSSLAVMANSLLLQFEGRKLQRLPRPQGPQPSGSKAVGSSAADSVQQQSVAGVGPAGIGGSSSSHVAPA